MTTPGPDHRKLDALVGAWQTTGQVWATTDSEPTDFAATDRYEWLAGGFFLIHHVDARMGADHVRALEVFRVRGAGYVLESYDSAGGHVVSTATLDGTDFRIVADAERFTGVFSPDGTHLDGVWERREGDEWLRWMTVSLVKQ